MQRWLARAVICTALVPAVVAAEPLADGSYRVMLSGQATADLDLGSVDIVDGKIHTVSMADEPFSNHFLSMRPFRCMEQDKQMWCHLPYPYDKPSTVYSDDLRSLEYEFLFIHRAANDYGIDAWNGLYFSVSTTETGLSGTVNDVDLNILASPPEQGVVWPIGIADLHESEPERHLYNKIQFVRQ